MAGNIQYHFHLENGANCVPIFPWSQSLYYSIFVILSTNGILCRKDIQFYLTLSQNFQFIDLSCSKISSDIDPKLSILIV